MTLPTSVYTQVNISFLKVSYLQIFAVKLGLT